MRSIALIAHNLRSSHNVGSLLRTADGLGAQVYLTGYTPYPVQEHDARLPHIAQKVDRQIQKTALGAETSVAWEHSESIEAVVQQLREQGYTIIALEQTADAQELINFEAPERCAVIVGREVEGIEPEVITLCDTSVMIPMLGKKESYNVTIAAAMAMYQLRYLPN